MTPNRFFLKKIKFFEVSSAGAIGLQARRGAGFRALGLRIGQKMPIDRGAIDRGD
tara:strand:+ start:1368 stop:1532 length:165 start_codon:yes stop_codon:yes gene_type:complete